MNTIFSFNPLFRRHPKYYENLYGNDVTVLLYILGRSSCNNLLIFVEIKYGIAHTLSRYGKTHYHVETTGYLYVSLLRTMSAIIVIDCNTVFSLVIYVCKQYGDYKLIFRVRKQPVSNHDKEMT